ncbi:hypothetical protein TCE0_043f15543 [Talaromyces pinophilus]|uniref:Uncharacterized protein n=1 Tax=Talaromyces pinophilus TaxID=128442 RepID=A0A0B8N483_TALPI|nr:hypothetical protein TCE0_043f15543 [Talaromyces pinophilus]
MVLVQPYWAVEIYANFAYFNSINATFYEKTRPLEALFRDPWWIFTTFNLFWVIKTHYNFGVVELVRESSRFGLMMASMGLSIAFLILDILSVTGALRVTSTMGINPFWKALRQHDLSYFVAEIAMRKLLQRCTMSVQRLSQAKFSYAPVIAAELERQLQEWYDLLPDELSLRRDNGDTVPFRGPAQAEFLHTQCYAFKASIYWPAVYQAMITGEAADDLLPHSTDLASKCKSFDGDVRISSYEDGALSLDGVTEITGNINFGYNPNLTGVVANDLATIGQQLYVSSDENLVSLNFPSLLNLKEVWLYSLPNLTEFTTAANFVNITSILIEETGLTTIENLQPKYVSEVRIANNPSLQNISLPIINSSNYVAIEQNIGRDGTYAIVSLPSLVAAFNVSISGSQSVDLSSLTHVGWSIGAVQNSFETLSLPQLLQVEDFMVWNNSALDALAVPSLTNVTGDITMNYHPKLRTIDFPALSRVGGDISVNGSFTEILVPDLTDVEGDINVYSSANLDCSTLDPYDKSDVFKGLYHCQGLFANASPGQSNSTSANNSSSSSSDSSSPNSTSSSGVGLSGAVKGGIAGGTVGGIFLLSVLVLFGVRYRKKKDIVQPDKHIPIAPTPYVHNPVVEADSTRVDRPTWELPSDSRSQVEVIELPASKH